LNREHAAHVSRPASRKRVQSVGDGASVVAPEPLPFASACRVQGQGRPLHGQVGIRAAAREAEGFGASAQAPRIRVVLARGLQPQRERGRPSRPQTMNAPSPTRPDASSSSLPPVAPVARDSGVSLADACDPEEHTRLAVDAAGLGTWELNPATGERRWSKRCLELFGLESDHGLTPERFALVVHPEDRDRWRAAFERATTPGAEGNGEYRVEYRTSGPRLRWIAATGRAFFENGRAVRVIGTVQDITERKVAEREREIFLGALGHDLRNPLTTIMIHSVLMQRRSGAAIVEPLGKIIASTKRMTRLIDDLVDFARGRTGELQIERTPLDLVDLCREALYEVTLPHPTRRVELSHFGDTRGEWDGDRIAQVVQNLTANAIEHGSLGSEIEVSVGDLGEAVRIAVTNRGAPIAPEMREHLFDPFRRGAHAGKGAGLGLYIVKEIVAVHGGSIDYVSEEDKTVFRVDLPRRGRHV
jgi:PAS domain S-box-containing protein